MPRQVRADRTLARLGVMTTGEQVQIGGNETYLSLCRRHWREAFEGRSNPSER